MEVEAGTALWEPDDEAWTSTRMGRFLTRAEQASGRDLPTATAAIPMSMSGSC